MTALSRPLLSLLGSAFEPAYRPPSAHPTSAATIDTTSDVVRLREPLTVALRRCLDAPDATWNELVERGAAVGEWDQWRVASLLAAAEPASDPEPEVTREELATLIGELIGRHDVVPGPWEGEDRQAAVETPRWRAGRIRRELVFAIERAMDCAAVADAEGLRAAAMRIAERDPADDVYPGLVEALVACADDLDELGALSVPSRDALTRPLTGTPFAATVTRLPTSL